MSEYTDLHQAAAAVRKSIEAVALDNAEWVPTKEQLARISDAADDLSAAAAAAQKAGPAVPEPEAAPEPKAETKSSSSSSKPSDKS